MFRKRKSIRLKNYDYNQQGAYYVTICTQNRKYLFGDVYDGKMVLNQYGKIVDQYWNEIPKHFPHVDLDEYIVMPNHIHGIIIRTGTACRAPTIERFGKPVSGSLSTIIRSFKSAVTKQINAIRSTPGIHVYQRNYYEHIIRNEFGLNRIRRYILNNPLNWKNDKYYTK